jgi:hypothetical protein
MGIKLLSELGPDQKGLVYLRGDGNAVILDEPELWLVALRPGEVKLSRHCGGLIKEGYAPMPACEGAVAIMAVIQGFEPPRALRSRDIPAHQTQFGQDFRPVSSRGNR